MTALIAVFVVLACWRVGRLVAVDQVGAPVRDWAWRRGEAMAYLFSCPWCISIWLSPLVALPSVAVLTDLDWGDTFAWVGLLTLAGSLVAGFGQTVEDRLDR